MTFLREYVFHPLVNKRVVPRRWLPVQYFGAMLFTMALCGLWHGASWTFVLWGTIHGIALVICSLWRRYGPRLPFLLGWALTVSFVLLSGVISAPVHWTPPSILTSRGKVDDLRDCAGQPTIARHHGLLR
jgi:alginate O-acetyltransferase complex protein AlgI